MTLAVFFSLTPVCICSSKENLEEMPPGTDRRLAFYPGFNLLLGSLAWETEGGCLHDFSVYIVYTKVNRKPY
jgi:hypothetical protein